ncbi:hypothetical protein O181_009034 [Austropuccinia psidii MF-1]|uniref:Chromo domain-containing protein n=1 Tax=Austropuccinia psidii MF-1 TaxID=1389203 RepID=A0A9Q3BNK5_9BASI|nr:hypothetical protein [Austropuccinia psidii MF-1]
MSICSDRGSPFVSSFLTQLCQQLKISRDLSTVFHPETDGQEESVNQILEQYLWMYSPFFTIYGKNPSFDSIHISQDTPAGNLSTKLQSVQKVFKEELESEIQFFKKYADRNREIPPDLQLGDKVWIASKIIKTTRPTRKLSERFLLTFEALKKIGRHAYHLKFPEQWQPVTVEEQEEWEVAQVLDSNLKRGILWYLVEWKGFNEDPESKTWEPEPKILSTFSSLCILTSLDQIPQEFYFMVLGGDWSL